MKQLLQSINDFDQLLDFLRDELDWPVDDYELDELVFDYDVDELGLKPEEAEKLKGGKIRQLRPLAGEQPFGIFFVEFGKNKLPIVVLRRILSQLVIKKRANAAEAKRWDTADLLFISAFGEAGDREIAFAHFHKEPDSPELPILRVLGWDGSDTPLKLDYVERELKSRLNWPDDESDQDAWREQWRAAFRHKPGYVIKTASALAETLAEFAKKIRDAAATIIEHESEEKGHLRRLHRGFRDALIHDLSEEDFADTYAQTVTYGLLTAAVSRTDPSGVEGTALITENITDMVPVTNPFLKEMLEEFLKAGGRKGGIDFDELGIQDVVELLRDPKRTDLAAVLRDFGSKKQGEDPVIHFYEHFLAAYNKQLRIQRGVFYTPQPVVSYIVRSVHELLQTEFGLEDGLASTVTWGEMVERNKDIQLPPLTDEEGETKTIDPSEPFVQILDPATGTATFPVEVIDVIHKHLERKWKEVGGLAAMPNLQGLPKDAPVPKTFDAYWQHYVPLGLLPRLFGYELLMAPYAIAHMKIGLKLHETGYRFGSEQRARIYLTNALEPKVKQLPQIGFDALAHEAEAVNEVKWYKRFTLIVGNPPYSLVSANMKPEHRALVERFKYIGEDRIRERGALQLEKILNDDYVKFISKSEEYLSVAEVGILGLITNHAYLDNPTMRGLRHSLISKFNRILIYDLGGSAKKLGTDVDENVFDIQQGVGIGVFVRRRSNQEDDCLHKRLLGTREEKYRVLAMASANENDWDRLSPTPPFYLFVPTDYELRDEYEQFVHLGEVFSLKSIGLFTSKDSLVIDWAADAVEKKVREFQQSKMSNSDLCDHVGIKAKAAWNVTKSRERLAAIGDLRKHIVRFLHRPFDSKYLFYERSLVWSMAWPVNRNLTSKGNIALTLSRQLAAPPWNHVFCSDAIVELCYITNKTKEGNHVFPLYVLPEEETAQRSLAGHNSRRLNFHSTFTRSFLTTLGFAATTYDELPEGLSPEDIFHYIYAVFHSPGYRSRYAEFLKIDFPRLPLTSSLELFRKLARLGGELTALHFLESPKLESPSTEFIGDNTQVSKVTYTPDRGGTVWIDGKGTAKKPQAGTSGFAPVPEEVWNFHIGGYQVCEKWLKDRGPKKGNQGRTLTKEDIAHYHKIVIALTETIRLMAEIDEVIEAHGGWPGAFQTEEKAK